MTKNNPWDDDYFDLIKSEQNDVELQELEVNKNSADQLNGKKGKRRWKSRPKSGYLYPITMVKSDSHPVHQALLNIHYFEDPNSDLNDSFLDSKEEDPLPISTSTYYFKLLWVIISIGCNSTFVIFPFLVTKHFYNEEDPQINEPLILNCWRIQCTAIVFIVFALIRRIFWLDLYFKHGRVNVLLAHGLVAGFSLFVWTTGIMYASDINSPFTAYILGYAFPPILSGLVILLGMTILKSSGAKKQNSAGSDSLQPIDSQNKSNNSVGASFLRVGNQLKSHHISYNEKLGTTMFYLGVLILLFSSLLVSNQGEVEKSLL